MGVTHADGHLITAIMAGVLVFAACGLSYSSYRVAQLQSVPARRWSLISAALDVAIATGWAVIAAVNVAMWRLFP